MEHLHPLAVYTPHIIVEYTPQLYVEYTPSHLVRSPGIMRSMTSTTKEDPDKRNVVCTSVGKSLKRLRLAAKLSQLDLANAAEVDRAYLSHIERGVGNPSVLTLANLCYVLGITLADLFKEVNVALPPGGETSRRANSSQSKPKVSRSRLR